MYAPLAVLGQLVRALRELRWQVALPLRGGPPLSERRRVSGATVAAMISSWAPGASLPTHGNERLCVRSRDCTVIVDDRTIPLTSSPNC